MAWVPTAGLNWKTILSLFSWNIAECDIKPQQTKLNRCAWTKGIHIKWVADIYSICTLYILTTHLGFLHLYFTRSNIYVNFRVFVMAVSD